MTGETIDASNAPHHVHTTAELLAEIAAGLGQSGAERLVREGTVRRWALVLESDAYEAWVIAWPAGTGLEMHDHDGSTAAMHVVNGQLRERFIGDDNRIEVRWLNAGDTVLMPGDHEHEVINLGTHEVVSVHVYSPRLKDQTFRESRAMG